MAELIIEKAPQGLEEANRRIQDYVDNPPMNKLLDLGGLGLAVIPSNISVCKTLEKLNLSFNQIAKIEGLEGLEMLIELDLSGNQIVKIEGLEKLGKLVELYLFVNQITTIEGLERLNKLTVLHLYDNRISKIDGLQGLENLTELDLSSNRVTNIEGLERLKKLSVLYLFKNKIAKIEGLDGLEKLVELHLFSNQITRIDGLERLVNLNVLHLSNNRITKIERLEELSELSVLYLHGNKIMKIEGLERLRNLNVLHLSRNGIIKMEGLDALTNLRVLNIPDNQISQIDGLEGLGNLNKLFVQGNQIDFSGIDQLKLFIDYVESQKIEFLKIHGNPFLTSIDGFRSDDYSKNIGVNDLELFLNDFQSIISEEIVKFKLPNKVVLIGNSSAGKTSLLEYLRQDKLQVDEEKKSTPSLNIVPWKPKGKPDVFFYDFGGQDYYHAIYKLFVNRNATYLLVWAKDSNFNHLNIEYTDERSEDYYTFSSSYWVGNIRYLLDKDHLSAEEKESTQVILVENKIDLPDDQKQYHNNDMLISKQHIDGNYVKQSFKISLSKKNDNAVYKLRRKLLKTYLQEHLVLEVELVKSQGDATIAYITAWPDLIKIKNYWEYSELIDHLKSNYPSWENLNPITSQQLMGRFKRAGMLIWYPSDTELKDKVWIEPQKVQVRIRELIDDPDIKNKGIIEQSLFESKNLYKEYGTLLLKQQIIFKDVSENEHKYIVPQALPLEPGDPALYEIAKDGLQLLFRLLFREFMPMGIMNRLICMFGSNPYKKSYTRYEMIFTYRNKLKVCVSCNFINLTINVSSNQSIDQIDIRLIKELYLKILFAYYGFDESERHWSFDGERWRMAEYDDQEQETKKEKKAKSYVSDGLTFRPLEKIQIPDDLFIGIEDNYYVKAKDLKDVEQNDLLVNVSCEFIKLTTNKDEESKPAERAKIAATSHQEGILTPKRKTYAAYLFNSFMIKPKQVAKKVFISYAHEDVLIKNRFLTHLAVLKRNRKVEVWEDGQIIPGEEWDDSIKKQIDHCDIFLMLLSPDFLASQYIWESELKRALDLNKTLFPILLSSCDVGDTSISKKQIVPNTISENDVLTLKPLKDWTDLDSGLYEVINQLKKHIN